MWAVWNVRNRESSREGRTKLDTTVRDRGVEVEDALAISERIDV